MRSPKPAKEDPALVAAREREQRRAENARTEETQAMLLGATQRRLRRFGKLSGRGSVPIITPQVTGGGNRGVGGGGVVSTGGGTGRGFDGPGFGGGMSMDGISLY